MCAYVHNALIIGVFDDFLAYCLDADGKTVSSQR